MVELLVVLAIVGILSALALPALGGMTKAYQLNVVAQLIVSQLTMARQTALTTNHAVQVRFYNLPDYGLSYTSTAQYVFRGVQCFSEGDIPPNAAALTSTPVTALTKVNLFPQPVIGSTNINSSVLLHQTPLAYVTASGNIAADPVLPNFGTNYSYVYIRYAAGGGATFNYGPLINSPANAAIKIPTSDSTSSTLTFLVEKAKIVDTTNGLPANYFTVSLDPVTGSVQLYRP